MGAVAESPTPRRTGFCLRGVPPPSGLVLGRCFTLGLGAFPEGWWALRRFTSAVDSTRERVRVVEVMDAQEGFGAKDGSLR
jgi:hypothetical protein